MSGLTHYFAFGSNMRRSRLLARIPNAAVLGRARLPGWRFACDKRGFDGSAKANIAQDEEAFVWGVVYRMPRNQLPRLDAFEGGYVRQSIAVVDLEGQSTLRCYTYTSSRYHHESVVFDWYKEHMVEGAREHRLPPDWLAMLERLEARPHTPRLVGRLVGK